MADIKYPGIRARGNSIQVDFRYKGIRCRETLKIKPTASNLKIAASKLGAINLDITLGNFIYSAHFPQSKKVKVFGHKQITNINISQALDWWCKNYSPKKESTLIKHTSLIRIHIKPALGDVLLRELKASQVKEWIKSVSLSVSLSVSSRNGILTPLRLMFAEAYSDELVDEDIMKRINNETRDKKNKNPLNIEEIDSVLLYLEKKSLEAKYYYQFAIWTGIIRRQLLCPRIASCKNQTT